MCGASRARRRRLRRRRRGRRRAGRRRRGTFPFEVVRRGRSTLVARTPRVRKRAPELDARSFERLRTSSSASSSASSAFFSPFGKKSTRAARAAFASASRRRLRPTRSREAIHSATSAAPPPSPRAHEAKARARGCDAEPGRRARAPAARARTFFSLGRLSPLGERLVSGRGSTLFRKPASSPRALRGRPRFVSPGTAPRAMNPATSGNVVLFLATRLGDAVARSRRVPPAGAREGRSAIRNPR